MFYMRLLDRMRLKIRELERQGVVEDAGAEPEPMSIIYRQLPLPDYRAAKARRPSRHRPRTSTRPTRPSSVAKPSATKPTRPKPKPITKPFDKDDVGG